MKPIKLKDFSILSKSEMKSVFGGSGIEISATCEVGKCEGLYLGRIESGMCFFDSNIYTGTKSCFCKKNNVVLRAVGFDIPATCWKTPDSSGSGEGSGSGN